MFCHRAAKVIEAEIRGKVSLALVPNSFLVHAHGMNLGWSKALNLEKHQVSLR